MFAVPVPWFLLNIPVLRCEFCALVTIVCACLVEDVGFRGVFLAGSFKPPPMINPELSVLCTCVSVSVSVLLSSAGGLEERVALDETSWWD